MRQTIGSLVLCALVAAGAAPAQVSSFFRNLGLTPEEMDLAGTVAEGLYTKPGIKAGNSADWKSETSKATGSVEVLDVTEKGRCVAFVHLIRPKPDTREQPMELRRCRSENGQWILVP